MRIRGLLTCGVWLFVANASFGQSDERPVQLPPLLPLPATEPQAPPSANQPPVIVYDPGYQYIPERSPEPARSPGTRDPHSRWWATTALELAWTSAAPAPQSLRLRPPDALGRRIPGLYIPLGGRTIDPFRVGLSVNVGRWFGDDKLHAIEGSLFILPGIDRTIESFAPGTLVVFPEGSSRSAPFLMRFPTGFDGVGTTFPATVTSTFLSGDVNYRVGLLIGESARLDLLAGYRFAYLEDSIYLGEQPEYEHDESLSNAYRSNRLLASSSFHGAQLGLSGEYRGESWYVEGGVKVAYGGVFTKTSASGAFQYSSPAPRFSNESQSAVLPTANLRLGYLLSPRSKAFVGYTFQYLSHVNRLGDLFNAGEPCNDFWVQSVSLGLEWHF